MMFADSQYKAGRFIGGLFYWLSVVGIVIGTIPLLIGLWGVFEQWQIYGSRLPIAATMVGLLYQAGIVLGGLFGMALAQVFKAHFDNADNSFKKNQH